MMGRETKEEGRSLVPCHEPSTAWHGLGDEDMPGTTPRLIVLERSGTMKQFIGSHRRLTTMWGGRELNRPPRPDVAHVLYPASIGGLSGMGHHAGI